MLDEMKELKLYSYDASDPTAFPVEGAMIRMSKEGKLAGVPRALELVARQSMFFDGASRELAATRAHDTIAILRDWCGFSSKGVDAATKAPGLDKIHQWMPNYLHALCKIFPEHDETDLLSSWMARRENFQARIFRADALTAPDHNSAPFEAVVARALRKGPLKRWCMAGRLVPSEACTTSKQRKDGTFARMSRRSNPTVIALTAKCLMELKKEGGVPQTGFVPVSLQELDGWLGRTKPLVRSDLEGWLYEGAPLFMRDSENAGIKRWRVDQEWLDDGCWQLIDVSDGDEALERFSSEHVGEGFRYYMDADYANPSFKMGPFRSLMEIER